MAKECVTREFTTEFRVTVQVPEIDPAAMSRGQRRAALGWVRQAEARLAGWKTRLINAERDQHGEGVAQQVVRDELQASKGEAKRDVEAASRMAELDGTSKALESGEIPAGHARLIARASSEGPIDEPVLIEAARHQGYDEFAKTVRRQQQAMSDDDGRGILERQKQKRTARAFASRETGMFVLSGEFDPITGAQIATVLSAKERELWNREDPRTRRTPQQRMADALAELILEPEEGKAKGTALMVIADYDVINQELANARLADGTPIPMGELIRLACDADILPGVFRYATQEMNLGRKRRSATETQRAALIYRDKECIGCGASALWCQAHHVRYWSDGGPTNLNNLVLVCPKCHHKIHDDGWDARFNTNTRHWELNPPPDPFPDHVTTSYRPLQHNPLLRN